MTRVSIQMRVLAGALSLIHFLSVMSWAAQDTFTSTTVRESTLAPQPVFSGNQPNPSIKLRLIEELIERNIARSGQVRVIDICQALEAVGSDAWMRDALEYQTSTDEVLIHYAPGYYLRYYDPQHSSSRRYVSADERVRVTDLAPLGIGSIAKQVICSPQPIPFGESNETAVSGAPEPDDLSATVLRDLGGRSVRRIKEITGRGIRWIRPYCTLRTVLVIALMVLMISFLCLDPTACAAAPPVVQQIAQPLLPAAQQVVSRSFHVWTQYGMRWAYDNATGAVYYYENNPLNTVPDGQWYRTPMSVPKSPGLQPNAHDVLTEPVNQITPQDAVRFGQLPAVPQVPTVIPATPQTQLPLPPPPQMEQAVPAPPLAGATAPAPNGAEGIADLFDVMRSFCVHHPGLLILMTFFVLYGTYRVWSYVHWKKRVQRTESNARRHVSFLSTTPRTPEARRHAPPQSRAPEHPSPMLPTTDLSMELLARWGHYNKRNGSSAHPGAESGTGSVTDNEGGGGAPVVVQGESAEQVSGLRSGSDVFDEQQYDDVLNITKLIVSQNPFSTDLIDKRRNDISRLSQIWEQVIVNGRETLEQLLVYTERHREDLSADDLSNIRFYIDELVLVTQYSIAYFTTLSTLNNIHQVTSEYGGKSHILERLRIAGVARLLRAISLGVHNARVTVRRSARELQVLGNLLEPGLYDEVEENDLGERTADEISRFLRKDVRNLGMARKYRSLKILASFFSGITFYLGMSFFFSWAGGIHSFADIVTTMPTAWKPLLTLSLFSLTTLCLFLFGQFGTIAGSYEITSIERRIERLFRGAPPPDRRTKILRQYRRFREALAAETDPDTVPGTDILIVTCGSEENRAYMEEELSRERGRLLRADIPLLCLTDDQRGSGMAFFEACRHLNDVFPGLQREYPHLRGRRLDEVRVVVINAGGAHMRQGASGLGAEALLPLSCEILGRRARSLDCAFITGYQAMQEAAARAQGGVAVINGDNFYIGPVHLTGEITLLSTWMSYNDISRQQPGLIVSDVSVSNTIFKVYEKWNGARVLQKLEKTALANLFDLSDHERQQMQGYAGAAVFSFSDPRRFFRFWVLIGRLSAFARQEAGSGGPRVDILRDMLIPLTMLSHGENIYAYLSTREEFRDPGTRNFYIRLFSLYRQFLLSNGDQTSGYPVHVSCPPPQSTLFAHLLDREVITQTECLLQGLRLAETDAVFDTLMHPPRSRPAPVSRREPEGERLTEGIVMSDDPRVQHHLLSGDVYEITTTADEGLMMRRVDYFAGDTGESTVSASDPVLLGQDEQIALVDWLRGHPGMRVCLLTREDAYVYAQERDEHRTTDTAAEGTIIYISRGLIPLLFGPGTDEVRTRVFAQGGLEGVVPPERGDGAAAERTPDALFAADTEPSEAATTRLAEQGGSTETAVTDRIGPASEALFRALVTAGLAGPLSSVSGAAQRLCSGAHVRICVPAEVLLDAPDTLAALARCAGAGEGQTIELVVLGVNKENKDALEALTDPVLRRAVGLDRSVSVHIVGDGELPLPGESVMGNRQWVESVSRMFPAGETDTDTLVITPPLNAPGANELSALMQGGCGQRCSICVPIEAGTGEVLSLARILQQWFVLLDEGRGSPVLVILPVLVPCAELIPELERYRDALWAALSAA